MGRTLLFLVSLLLCGCSTRVEVSTERRPALGDPPATKSFSTKVAVDLLTNPPAPVEVTQPEVEVAGDANFALIVEGDFHLHTHHHIHTDCLPTEERPASRRHQEKSEPVEIETRRTGIDPRCERLLREHVEQAARWRKMMGL